MGKVLEALGPAYGPQEPGHWMAFEPCQDLPGYPRFGVRKIVSGQDYCEVFFDSRLVPGQTNAGVLADLTNLVDTLAGACRESGRKSRAGDARDAEFPAMPATQRITSGAGAGEEPYQRFGQTAGGGSRGAHGPGFGWQSHEGGGNPDGGLWPRQTSTLADGGRTNWRR